MAIKKILILGGARSGKSDFALQLGESLEGDKAFVATASHMDDEMRQRIKAHQQQRGPQWTTYEISLDLSIALIEIAANCNVIIVDCLTLWLSNLMYLNKDPKAAIHELLRAFKLIHPYDHLIHLLMVSNEVGMGIVPENKLARTFRDLSGYMNAAIAKQADEVYLVTAGIPLLIKGASTTNVDNLQR
jgi:adenosylcobinamide kinase/adenosylcobinamide-phosphate guanylyltransferase